MNRKPGIIYPEDDWKGKWDLYITLILIFTCLSTPYLISFEAETCAWEITNYTIDGCFFVDIIFNFLQAYYNDDFNIVDSHKKIAGNYLRGWFLIDTIAIIPIDKLFAGNSSECGKSDGGKSSGGGANKMLRLTRIGRMSKLIKLTRLLRVLKIIKEKSKFLTYLQDILKISQGFQRLFMFIAVSLIVIHISSCLWVFCAVLLDEKTTPNWLAGNCPDEKCTKNEQYLLSMYFIVTTMTTVGYGDISPSFINPIELVFGIFLMISGVMVFTIASATLSSIL